MSKAYYLPEDLIFNVLARLPVRTLLQLRCVSKSWATLIDSPEFIKFQLNISLMDPTYQKLIFETLGKRHLGSRSRSSFMHLPGNFNSQQKVVSSEELYCPEPVFDQGKKLVGSSNGLICIRYVKDGVILSNPWTRRFKKLPRSPIEIKFSGGRNWIYTIYGFGYDDLNDDYKVVTLAGVRDKVSREFCNEVKVYSLKFNSWKKIDDLPHATIKRASGILLNHSLHWIMTGQESILAIDLRTEERQFLPLPDDFKTTSILCPSILGVSDGTLCISKVVLVGFEIWLMKDYGTKDSWTMLKVDILGLSYSTPSLVRYSASEKQLIFSDMYRIYWYDIEKKILCKTEDNGALNFFYTVESLVQPRSDVPRGRRSKSRNMSWN